AAARPTGCSYSSSYPRPRRRSRHATTIPSATSPTQLQPAPASPPALHRQPLAGVIFSLGSPWAPPGPAPPVPEVVEPAEPPAPRMAPPSKPGTVTPPSGFGRSTHAPALHSWPCGHTASLHLSTQAPAWQTSVSAQVLSAQVASTHRPLAAQALPAAQP